MCCSEKAGTLAGGSRMRAGVHPVSSGLRQAACSPPAPRFHAGSQGQSTSSPPGTLPVFLFAAAPGKRGGDGGGGGPPAPAASDLTGPAAALKQYGN